MRMCCVCVACVSEKSLVYSMEAIDTQELVHQSSFSMTQEIGLGISNRVLQSLEGELGCFFLCFVFIDFQAYQV